MSFTKAFLGLLALYAGLIALATAGTQTGQVTDVFVRASDGLVYFQLSGTSSDRPACAANHTYWMIKDEKSLTGKQQLAMLMQAQATGQTVAVSGAGTCTRWADGEDTDGIRLILKQ